MVHLAQRLPLPTPLVAVSFFNSVICYLFDSPHITYLLVRSPCQHDMARLQAYEEALDEEDEDNVGEREEGEIIARLEAGPGDCMYEDVSFPAQASSLYR